MPNCFAFAESLILGIPEKDWQTPSGLQTSLDIRKPVSPQEANLVLKVDEYGNLYHAAVPAIRGEDGSILTVQQRFGGGYEPEVVSLETLQPRDPNHKIIFALAVPR